MLVALQGLTVRISVINFAAALIAKCFFLSSVKGWVYDLFSPCYFLCSYNVFLYSLCVLTPYLPKKIMMQLILIFLRTTFRGSNYYISLVILFGLFSDLSQSFESAFIKLASADNGLANIKENITLYIQLFIFIMFFIQNIYDNKHCSAWPFCAKICLYPKVQ